MEGAFGRVNWDKPRLFYDKATWSELSMGGEEGRDEKVRSHKKRKKALKEEREPHPDWQSTVGKWLGRSQPKIKKEKSG